MAQNPPTKLAGFFIIFVKNDGIDKDNLSPKDSLKLQKKKRFRISGKQILLQFEEKIMRENGRSMVEMLGVLAIIGVLSVGAMSGYAKAMLKYKLNKQAESLNMLFTNAFQILRELDNTSSSNSPVHFAEIMYKLNLVPDGIKFDSRLPTYLTDIFGNRIWVFAYPVQYGIGYSFYPGHDGMEICRNLFNVYKQNADVLYYISTDRFISNDEDEEEYERGNAFYGNNYCSKSNKCIYNMSLNDIDTLCGNCLEDSTRCRFYAVWR